MGIFEAIRSAFSKSEAGTGPDAAATTKPTGAEAASEPGPEPVTDTAGGNGARVYTVASGDTLWRIAERELGNGSLYTKIFEANRDVLDDPDRILPGQKLVIPEV